MTEDPLADRLSARRRRFGGPGQTQGRDRGSTCCGWRRPLTAGQAGERDDPLWDDMKGFPFFRPNHY